MKKSAFEQACRAAGMAPEKRVSVLGTDVYIADGFSAKPEVNFQKFGVTPDEFPGGAYATMWCVFKGETLDGGRPLLFELFHNPEFDHKTKKMARINTAIKEATAFLSQRERIRKDG